MFSIYILTYNEEIDIAECIESALQCDDIIVVDSFSSDRTVEIAQRYRVRVVQHRFESHGKQRTWMLREVPAKYEWVYILEADERFTAELFQECLQAIQSSNYIGYYVAERVMFMGSWIPHSTQFPRYQMRLFRKDKVWFDDYGHTEREVCEGATGFLKETYPHYTCGKGLSRWLEKHNRYSTDEAAETLHQLESGTVNWHDLLGGTIGSRTTQSPERFILAASVSPYRPLYLYVLFLGRYLGWRGGVYLVYVASILRISDLAQSLGNEAFPPTPGRSSACLLEFRARISGSDNSSRDCLMLH